MSSNVISRDIQHYNFHYDVIYSSCDRTIKISMEVRQGRVELFLHSFLAVQSFAQKKVQRAPDRDLHCARLFIARLR